MRVSSAFFCTSAMLAVAGCAMQPPVAVGPAPVAPVDMAAPAMTAPPAAEPVRYSAKTFFDTTSFNMAASTGLAFSADGQSLLIGSDKSGRVQRLSAARSPAAHRSR